MAKKLFNTKIGLALGGGAAKGIAHVGVLKALEDQKVSIRYIAGTSVGAIIASLYAFNVSVDDIGGLAKRLTMSKVTSFKLSKTGFFTTASLRDLIVEYIGEVNIEDAKIPLAIVATDIRNGEEIILRKGSVADAVSASAAIPGIYIPVEIDNRSLVDGGLVQNVPIEALQAIWHRGAVDADGMTGDGAGIHIEIPRDFFIEHIARTGHDDDGGRLAVGMVFLPRTDLAAQERCRCIVEQEILSVGHSIYGWRQVPINVDVIGEKANASRPEIEQIMLSTSPDISYEDFERDLYVVRRRIERRVLAEHINDFYICSLSCRSVVYKGMFLAERTRL